jgi:hypothetical protein
MLVFFFKNIKVPQYLMDKGINVMFGVQEVTHFLQLWKVQRM